MIGFAMRLVPQGSFAWLTLHEMRLSWAARSRRKLGAVIGWALLLVWAAAGIWIAWLLRDVPIHLGPIRLTAALAASIMLFTFMTTQSILASQRTLFEAGDLDLLFTAPVPPRNVVRAKLVGITAAVVLSFAMLVLPLTLPLAILGHPQLFGIPALLLALALTAACFGLAVTLLLARVAGPRAARTVGQIVAALSGGAIFLVSQLWNNGDRGSRGGMAVMFQKMVDSGFGTRGIAALPGMAAFGDPWAVTALLAGSLLLFAGATAAMQTLFLASYRAGGMKLSRTRRATGTIARHFHKSLFGAIYAKEWRLLLRDPALAFQVVLRLVYLTPILFVALRPGRHLPIAPVMAFSSVLIAGQVVSSFVWLAVSAEDTPDLIKVAPVEKHAIDRAKLTTAMAMAAPLTVLLPIGIGVSATIPGAIVALGFTALAGWMTGLIEVMFAKPAPRASFRQRRGGGSFLRGLLGFGITVILGGVAAVLVYFLDPVSRTTLPDWSRAGSALNASTPRY